MNAKTLKALKASIAHWERLATGKLNLGENPYGYNCPLCKLFIDNKPVSKACKWVPRNGAHRSTGLFWYPMG